MNRLLKILWLTGLTVLLVGFGYLFYHKFVKLRELRRQQIIYQERIDLLEDDVARLSKEIAELRNDPAQLEKLAREKLGLVGKNEKIFIIEPTPHPE
ncbi:MAG: septum formation initiator family protein [Candidatus Euphemobacter frigidus]|nr:septum formation initiator family protein [Candidatus Euphemobacter frigidus]MDP8276139.1 septum formation initiator family protein [Candidatus Euphemobacter frigidus]